MQIYYFTGTGNSLSIAKKLNDKLDGELVSISKVLNDQKIVIDANEVGFVFPIYAWGIPRIVRDFIKKAQFRNVSYTFAVAGCAGIAGKSLPVLKKLLKKKGVMLNSGFIVSESSNAIDAMHKFMVKNKGDRDHRSIDIRLDKMAGIITDRKNIALEKDAPIANTVGNFINKMASIAFKRQDANYWVTDDCTHCGICKKACPRTNITIEENGPVWHHNCEYCMACISWCPNAALQSGDSTQGMKRYRKNGITVKDIL
ncbi:MAG: EFR1 family ferrodoxin [Clostridiales bacterium]|nr:EFR1 family ferrodoxin [Clostridiales bacterium]